MIQWNCHASLPIVLSLKPKLRLKGINIWVNEINGNDNLASKHWTQEKEPLKNNKV